MRRVFEGAQVPPTASGLDGLVVMGGPMSACSDDGFPSRPAELRLIADAAAAGIPTLGVCLGAQLLASALGARVYRGSAGPEIGWAPIRLSDDAAWDPLFAGLPRRLEVLHWHGDTYDLPPGATHLASSARYPQQAFRFEAACWGVQFHLEVDRGAVAAFTDAFADEAATAGEGLSDATTVAALAALAEHRRALVTRFAGLVSGRAPADVRH